MFSSIEEIQNKYLWPVTTVFYDLLCYCSVTKSCLTLSTPWTAALQVLSFTISWSLLKLMFVESVMPSNHLILCHPILLLPSIFISYRVFSNESALCIRWPNYWSFSFSISPFSEYSVLISFRIEQQPNIKYQNLLNIANMEHRGKIIVLNAFMKEYSSGKE